MSSELGSVRGELGVGPVIGEPDGAFLRGWRRWALRSLNVRRPGPDRLDFKPNPLMIGAPEAADRMFRGVFIFDGVGARAEDGDPWSLTPPTEGWAESLHGFRWLEHFAAAGGMVARESAHALIKGWLAAHNGWRRRESALAWRPAVAADRLSAWLVHYALVLQNAEIMYRSSLLRAIEAHSRYLERFGGGETAPMRRLAVGSALVMSGLCMNVRREAISPGLRIAETALNSLLLADGGPVSRAPSDLLECLTRVAMLRKAMIDSDRAAPDFLTRAETVGAKMLRFLRHRDGGLALFNGGREARDDRIDRLLAEIGVRDGPPEVALHSGFERAARGRTTLFMDAGEPGPAARANAHAGALSIEVSSAGRRLIVNCGSAAHMTEAWIAPFRSTAAHSALTIGDASSARIGQQGRGAMRAPARIVERERALEAEGAWLMAAHEGYGETFGLGCRRRLFLSANGEDLRGEDTLYTLPGREAAVTQAKMDMGSLAGLSYEVRFHLHPDVSPQLDPDTSIIWLAVRGGELWSFRQAGGRASIEGGGYFGHAGPPTDSRHILIRARLVEDSHQVKWGLKRENVSGRSARDPEAFNATPEILKVAEPSNAETATPPGTLAHSK